MLVALSYGKNHVTSLPIKGLETNKKIKNVIHVFFQLSLSKNVTLWMTFFKNQILSFSS